MIDFRSLGYFVAACEHENLGAAADEIGIAPSTLSASLKLLEGGFGASLFRRHENGLAPRRLAHWLYRAAVPLLLLEEFARRRVKAPQERIARLSIEIRLRFAFGQFRRALANAIAATAEQEPLLLVDPQWTLEASGAGVPRLGSLDFDREMRLTIEPLARDADPATGEIALRHDPWTLVERRFGAEATRYAPSSLGQPWMVPALPAVLVAQISARAAELGRVVRVLDTPPDEWPQILDEHPSAIVALPASAVGTRLGVSRIVTAPLDPPLFSTLVARPDGSPQADAFLRRLQAALEDGTPSRAFDPQLTERRVRYFNLAYETGRVSAAAKAAGVAQPAMSQQLQKLEESLGVSLFDRNSFGLVRTEAAGQLALATAWLDRQLRDLEVSGATAALAEGGRLSLGILPSASQHGRLVNVITGTVLALRDQYPALSLLVREAPNAHLQRWVKQGKIGIAIVDTAPAQMPRLTLDSSEPLAVIVHPRHRLLAEGPVAFADLASLPLVLPTELFGLRQLLDAEARAAGFELKPRHEINALSMLIALVSRDRIATVLPPSAVGPDIAAGKLIAHPIAEPVIERRLFVIYSGDRSLTPAEREFVRLLRAALAAVDDPPGPAAAETGHRLVG